VAVVDVQKCLASLREEGSKFTPFVYTSYRFHCSAKLGRRAKLNAG
jgi:hypothetical protein